ncbi:MAG: hypothetical protein U9O94_02000 [Nanoarchaeota archaeon]|nr:hypothetical protein [Nanoarchaeota archaeon]
MIDEIPDAQREYLEGYLNRDVDVKGLTRDGNIETEYDLRMKLEQVTSTNVSGENKSAHFGIRLGNFSDQITSIIAGNEVIYKRKPLERIVETADAPRAQEPALASID